MKDVVYIQRKYRVSVRTNSLFLKHLVTQEEIYLPFDNMHISFSNEVISKCLDNDIQILVCDEKHSPLSLIVKDFGHHKKAERLRWQIFMSQKSKGRIWKKIIKAKIYNQALCLENNLNDYKKSERLKKIIKSVEENDPNNREAYSARLYFNCLFGEDFRRGRYDDIINSSLNYGYAIIRSSIRKELVIHGLEVSLGIFHKSSENPFNLSDDIIEPFRPFIDSYVYEHIISENVNVLDIDQKIKIVNILFEKCVIDGKIYTIQDAIKVCVTSLIKCYEEDSSAHIQLPIFIDGGK